MLLVALEFLGSMAGYYYFEPSVTTVRKCGTNWTALGTAEMW